ncbi:hypothetical protein G7Y79_00005g017240 [Physcia stellaris]|nr:hypothetical protein G7Y79_00005g017240 [Physcia stellaris]
MARRTVMRMSLAQMEAMREPRSQPSTPEPEPTDMIYCLTVHITKANNAGVVYGIVFGPSRSRSATAKALTENFPRTTSFPSEIGSLEWERNNHFRWTEPSGDAVIVKLESERNAAVCAGSQEHIFFVNSRIVSYDDDPVSDDAEIRGWFLTKGEANGAASEIFRNLIQGWNAEGVAESVKENGMLVCMAQSSGQGGYRWTLEVEKLAWTTT